MVEEWVSREGMLSCVVLSRFESTASFQNATSGRSFSAPISKPYTISHLLLRRFFSLLVRSSQTAAALLLECRKALRSIFSMELDQWSPGGRVLGENPFEKRYKLGRTSHTAYMYERTNHCSLNLCNIVCT